MNFVLKTKTSSPTGATVHSSDESLDDHIYISERPLNELNFQIILENAISFPCTSVEKLFKNKQRRTIRMQNFTEDYIREVLFKNFITPNKTNAILTDDQIFKKIQNVYSQFFLRSKIFKIIRCTEILIDLPDSDVQDNLILSYHVKNNHKGINETLVQLKRTYFFPNMKNKITQTINNSINLS